MYCCVLRPLVLVTFCMASWSSCGMCSRSGELRDFGWIFIFGISGVRVRFGDLSTCRRVDVETDQGVLFL